MHTKRSYRPDFAARLSFWLLFAFFVILWITGGASRADVAGQAITRLFAWFALIVFAILSPHLNWRRAKPILVLLGGAVTLALLQLIPLPPEIWAALPGRELFVRAADVSGQSQPWRPLSVSPSHTVNALGSLVVPVTVLCFATNMTHEQHWRIAELILALVLAGSLIALLQFSGANIHNPFINYVEGSVSGNFANRNHFALFVAIGCVIAPVWIFRQHRRKYWKAIVGTLLLPFFLLIIFATGSRAGLILACAAMAGGLFIVRTEILSKIRALPKWGAFSAVAATVLAFAGVIFLSYFLGRAVSVQRAVDLGKLEDLRARALPYVLDAISRYFPAGSGFGTFDPVYRIGEPDSLLQIAYFNHAHNDWLEVLLDGGIAGAVLIISALGWIAFATFHALRRGSHRGHLALAGSIILVLIMLASIVDYPARTPMMMAMIVMGAIWLHPAPHSCSHPKGSGHSRL